MNNRVLPTLALIGMGILLVLFIGIILTDMGAGNLPAQRQIALQETRDAAQATAIIQQTAVAEAVATAQFVEAENIKYFEPEPDIEGLQITDSGLRYEVVREADGVIPDENDIVEVDYRGLFVNGQEFDSSYARGETARFPLNGVIPGWTEGLQLMSVGSEFRFYIPPELAYGAAGSGPIPGNTPLIFDVELLDVEAVENPVPEEEVTEEPEDMEATEEPAEESEDMEATEEAADEDQAEEDATDDNVEEDVTDNEGDADADEVEEAGAEDDAEATEEASDESEEDADAEDTSDEDEATDEPADDEEASTDAAEDTEETSDEMEATAEATEESE